MLKKNLIIFFVCIISSQCYASIPPKFQVFAWIENNHVNYKVFDPVRNTWVNEISNTNLEDGFVQSDGVIAWRTGSTSFYYTIYDLRRGEWMTQNALWNFFGGGTNTDNKSGRSGKKYNQTFCNVIYCGAGILPALYIDAGWKPAPQFKTFCRIVRVKLLQKMVL